MRAGPFWCAAIASRRSARTSKRAMPKSSIFPADPAARIDGPAFASLPASLQRDAVGRSGAEGERGLSHRARRASCARDACARASRRLRDLGTEGAGYADVALKRAIDEGIDAGAAPVRRRRAPSWRPAPTARRARNSGPIAASRKAPRRRAASTRSCARCAIRRAMAPTGSRSMPIIAPARAARRCATFSVDELKALVETVAFARPSGRSACDQRRRHAPRRRSPASTRSSTAMAARARPSR